VSETPELRASDAQRDQAAAELQAHFAAGRLTDEELAERVDRAYHARTQGELQALRADLPALPASVDQVRAAHLERRAQLRREMLQQAGGMLVPFLICVVIWAATGADGFFWPIFVAFGAIAVLVRSGWQLYGPAPDLDRVEAELERRREHGDGRAAHGGHRPHRGHHHRRDGRRA
jgi:hypothetical protein